MVAKISQGESIRGILHYNESKVQSGEAKVVLASGFATDIDRLNMHQKLYRFELLNQLRPSVKVNALHISLNFHADDKLDTAKMQAIAAEYMEKIGFGEQPFIAYQHFDAAHPHLHIATTRIDREGKAIDINKIGWRLSEPARKELEEKYGLIKAQGRVLGNEPYLRAAEYGLAPTKKQLNNITKAVMRDYAYASFEQYKAVLAQFNVHVDRGFEDSVMFEKKGLVYSIADCNGSPIGVPFKASSFYSGATMKNLEKRFEKNSERRRDKKEYLMRTIDRVFDRYDGLTMATFQRELAAEQVATVFRRNDSRMVYGLTFIDHSHRTVFNGSDLGKNYSAKTVTSRLSMKDLPKVYLGRIQDTFRGMANAVEYSSGQKKENPLGALLEKVDYDPIGQLAKKKRKKRAGKDRSHGF